MATPESSDDTYSPTMAIEEYNQLMARRDAEGTKRKQEGTRWPCFDCRHAYPPAGYGVERDNEEEIHLKCVAPGYWRHCNTCRKVCEVALATYLDVPTLPTRRCTGCDRDRATCYFDADMDLCKSCIAFRPFKLITCQKCGKCTQASELTEMTAMKEDDFICATCGLENHTLACSLCKVRRTRIHFREDQRKKNDKKERIRCNTCARCIVCERNYINDFSRFAPGERYCLE